MRSSILAAVAALTLALATLPAIADENFIPLGQDYGLGNDDLPPLNSAKEKFNAQVDVYQSEVYNRQLSQKQFDSRIFNLINDQEPGDLNSGPLDY